MNILDHGGPKAQVHLEGFSGKSLFFSQVRDAVFYLRMPERDGQVLAAYVTDMGSIPDWNTRSRADWVLAAKAAYVVGSDRLGGMEQPEFVPFAEPARARAFAAEHGGRAMRLDQIPDSALASPGQTAEAGDDADADLATRLHNFTKTQGN
jgi:copper chaperone NosL